MLLFFSDQCIDLEAFNNLSNEYIKELIPVLGDQIKFTKRFSIYQQTLLQESLQEILKASGHFTPLIRNRLVDLIIRNELRNDETKRYYFLFIFHRLFYVFSFQLCNSDTILLQLKMRIIFTAYLTFFFISVFLQIGSFS
jgi:hypothetical protein